MSITQEVFGQTSDGGEVTAFIFTNSQGMKVKIINYGATMVSVDVPDRDGKRVDVVLGFDDMAGYQSVDDLYFGACCGRFANRIARGMFSLDGVEYALAINNGPNALHGGQVGFDKRIWEAERVGDHAVKMTLISPDGEEGYPGTLRIELLYSLSEANELTLKYTATTDKKTVLNLTNHSYFNLAGSGLVHDHVIQIFADRYTLVDDEATPSGAFRRVVGTEMDLLSPTPIGKNIDAVQGAGFDHNYCINQPQAGTLVLAAHVLEPKSGRTLQCWTTEPGVQFYTGNFIGLVQGKGGAVYKNQEGFCLETQHYPDSPNHSNFPSTELARGETYTQTCIYQFGLEA